ncbi:MAG: DUF1571 domain-containing protein [Deltaproteobacteria bacterium]|nr:DUF1571 domain-containing protein [Deltaproteobacteria bacterium]
MRSIAAVLLLALPGIPASAQEPSPPTVDEIMKQVEVEMAKVKDYTAIMYKQERFVDKLGPVEKMSIKFASPFKVYIKFLTVHKGREAIYVRGRNSNEAKVHKGSFPDLTVNLDPRGSMAMEGNHHPVTDFGLDNTMRVARKNLATARKHGEGEFSVTDGGLIDGKATWRIESKFPRGGYFTTAKDDETLWHIADRTGQDMYVIMYCNRKNYDEPDDPDEGDKVFIPRYYGGRSEFFLEKKTLMPLKVTTWDWDGKMYETYEYHDLKLNVGLSRKDFDPDNKAYDF